MRLSQDMTAIVLNVKRGWEQMKFEKISDNIFHEKTDSGRYKVKLTICLDLFVLHSISAEK